MGPKTNTKSQSKSKSKTRSGITDGGEIPIPEPALVTPTLEGTDTAALPFQEWLDSSLNAEKWDGGAAAKDKAAKQEPGAPEELEYFKDPQMVYLPNSIVAQKWKRPSEIYPGVEFIIYEEKPAYPDLISGSKHLLHSEFVRSFISSIQTLLYLGNTSQFNIEYISPSYTPTTENIPWRPWHHIYSNCKAGKGQDHSPTVNTIGKYVVRLFWMGSWKKIYVDDLLPVDLLDHVLLPSLELTKEELEKLAPKEQKAEAPPPSTDNMKKLGKPDSKTEPKKRIEMWPFLLSKALLKIASLSWYDDREILDFDIIQCLSGWIPQKLHTKGLDIHDIWDICSSYTNHFCWPPEKSETSTKASKASKKDKKGKGKGKGKKGSPSVVDMDSELNAHHLLARCNDLRNFAEDEILDISPCWSHYFLIDQTRDIPILKPTLTADLAFWKRFRWLAWKVQKGLVPAEELRDRIRCFKVVSPFKKIYEHVVYKQPSKMALNIETAVNIIAEETKKGKGKDKGKGKGKADKKKDKKSSKGSKKSSKSGKSGKGKAKKIDVSLIPNPSIWVDSENLSSQVNSINIYLKPSRFKTKYAISDLALNKPAKDAKPQSAKKGGASPDTWKYVVHPKTIMICRNEPIYIFTDSIDYKLIVVNLVQEAYTPILKIEEEPPVSTPNDITECEFCVSSLVKRIKRNITNAEVHNYISLSKVEAKPIIHDRPKSNLILEKFNWQTEKLGEMLSSFSTWGTKTVNLELPPGRQLLRLWISSEMSYVVHILSDTPMVIGCLEGLLFQISQESQLLMNTCIEIASCYGKLVQAFGMPEFPIQLKAYYNSYKPDNYLTKAESAIVHDTFYNLLHYTVEECLSESELRALSILFFKWQFPLADHYMDELEFCHCHEAEDVYFVKTLQWYTVRIQAFFRGVYERALMKRHNPEHKEHLAIFERLKAVYTAIFSTQKRLVMCPNLLRVFLDNPNMSKIRSKYSISDDLENVIMLQEVNQTVKLPANDWGLICRQPFFVNSLDPLLVKINLFCNLSNYFVRVFDNDTKEEIRRYANNVTVHEYESNVYGYTVLCYGFSPESKQLQYKLSFALKREVVENKLVVPSCSTRVDIIRGNYIPNVNNYICRYLVHVFSNNILLTIRFSPGYENAIVNLKLMDDFGIVIQEVTGSKYILLPAIALEPRDRVRRMKTSSDTSVKDKRSSGSLTGSTKSLNIKKSEKSSLKSRSVGTGSKKSIPETETIYIIEATVVNDTWPLNAEEWKNVNQLKTDMLYGPSLKDISSGSLRRISFSTKSSDSSKKRGSTKRSEIQVYEPYWMLQTICNTGDAVQFTKHTRREEEIRNMKSKWYEDDIMRYQMSKELRQTFLYENQIENDDLPEAANMSNIRRLSSNFFATEILPPYDLSEFMIKTLEVGDEVKGDTRKLKTEIDFERDIDEQIDILDEFQLTHERLIEEMDQYVIYQISSFDLLNNWFNECRSESAQMMNDALNLKAEYVKKILDELNKDTGKKGKKEKGGKGGKGGKGKKK